MPSKPCRSAVPWTSHADYQAHARSALAAACASLDVAKSLWAYQHAAVLLWVANLDPLAPIVQAVYKGHGLVGRPPRDPGAMLRTWLLATTLQCTSPDDWARRLATDSVLAILSGFDPADTPGASTLRDFLSRLVRTMRRRARCHRPHRACGKGPGKGKKKPLRRPDLLWRLQVRLPRFAPGDEGPLQELLAAIAHGSAERGRIDLAHLSVAGDSTLLPAHVNPYGRRTCACPPGTPCTHLRRFTDGDATWGWDSSRNSFIFGHRFYELTAAGAPHDLPLYLRAVGADRHDSPSWLLSWHDFRRYYPDADVFRVLLDSAHDAGAIFDDLERASVQAIIDLNPAHHHKHPLHLTDDGIPLCACGQPMAPDGSSRGRLKFVCPRRRKRAAGDQPPCPHALYLAGTESFRLHPGLARGTQAWRLAYNGRTGTERSHTRKRNDLGQVPCRRRSRPTRTAHYFLAAYVQHFAAWTAHSGLRIEAIFRAALQPHLSTLLPLPRGAAA